MPELSNKLFKNEKLVEHILLFVALESDYGMSNHTHKKKVLYCSLCLEKTVTLLLLLLSTCSDLLTVALHQHVRSHLLIGSNALFYMEMCLTDNYRQKAADLTLLASVVLMQNIFCKVDNFLAPREMKHRCFFYFVCLFSMI